MTDRRALILGCLIAVASCLLGCDSSCPQGRAEVGGRCKSIDQLIREANAGMSAGPGDSADPTDNAGQKGALPVQNGMSSAGKGGAGLAATSSAQNAATGTMPSLTGGTNASGPLAGNTSGVAMPSAQGGSGSSAGGMSAVAGTGSGKAECGNGVLEGNETCDPPEQCPTEETCNATMMCVRSTLAGDAKSCTAKCEQVTIVDCMAADGCCPMGCNFGNDEDCSKSCGDGVISPPETCEANSQQPCVTSCDDGNACTMDTLTGSPSQCSVACAHMAIGAGMPNDCGGCKKLSHAKGESCTAGSGLCLGRGQYVCEGQDSVACNAVPKTAMEECDGADNDCDGKTDEGVQNRCGGCRALDHDVGASCTTGANGSCRGSYMCNGKDATQCKAQNVNTEACDNVDNDCDGKVDEDTSQGSACQITKGSCTSKGKWTCMMGASICDAPPVGSDFEICGNGKDDDCDSKVDEHETGTGQPYAPAWFLDCDLDGVGNPTIATNSCSKPPNAKGCPFVQRSGDSNEPPLEMCSCP